MTGLAVQGEVWQCMSSGPSLTSHHGQPSPRQPCPITTSEENSQGFLHPDNFVSFLMGNRGPFPHTQGQSLMPFPAAHPKSPLVLHFRVGKTEA